VQLKLTVVSGPHQGKEFVFDGRDTFLVGRTKDAHFQLSNEDPYFSRRHFMIEVNPPRCRLIDLNSRSGTLVNGARTPSAELVDGDEIAAGQTVFKVQVIASETDSAVLLDLPTMAPHLDDLTADYQPPSSPVPGYQIDGELGRGGMGVVYRGRRDRDGLAVALKTITPAAGTNHKYIDRFLREGRILAQLAHPNIVAFQEVLEANGLIYLVMDLVNGPDATTRLRQRGPENIPIAVRIICQMLSGLAHAHSKGFVHRDIKPSNILIERIAKRQTAKLADFGLARAFESSQISGLTMQGEVGGTPAFMAPEQLTHYREVKPAADQYSAAATLYNMLTNKTTHDLPKDVAGQLAEIVTADAVLITQRKADIPPDLAVVIHKALSREPGDRYPDVLAFRKELKRFA
jgi:serine/threonine protein kinase